MNREAQRQTSQRSLAGIVGGWSANALKIVPLLLGAVTAVFVEPRPWLALFLPPLVYVLHRSDSVKHLEIAASTDRKTGLLTVEMWRCLAEAGLRKARRDHVPTAVLVLDLDFFKRINDTQGHLFGDDALRAVVQVISSETRRTDLVGRFGGEEFVVFLSDVNLRGATERRHHTVKAGSVPAESGIWLPFARQREQRNPHTLVEGRARGGLAPCPTQTLPVR